MSGVDAARGSHSLGRGKGLLSARPRRGVRGAEWAGFMFSPLKRRFVYVLPALVTAMSHTNVKELAVTFIRRSDKGRGADTRDE